MLKVLLIALAGSLGTLCRYWLSGAVYSVLGRDFPWGTACVNVLGCMLFGLVWALSEHRLIISGETRTIILVGFMGGFTTFSSLIFETSELMRQAQYLYAALNFFGENILGFASLFIGMALGRVI